MEDKYCKMIILEGVDRSGKGTMWDEINRQTNYQHVIVDRGPIGFKTYAKIFNRSEDLIRSYESMESGLVMLDALEMMSSRKRPMTQTIYLDCDTDVLVERCWRSGHEVLNFNHHKEVYEKEVKNSRLNVITVDTSKESVEHIVSRLIAEGVL